MQLVVVDIMEAYDVGMTLTLSQKLDFALAVLSPTDDLDGILFASLLVSTATTDREGAITKNGLLQVEIIVLEKWRVLKKMNKQNP